MAFLVLRHKDNNAEIDIIINADYIASVTQLDRNSCEVFVHHGGRPKCYVILVSFDRMKVILEQIYSLPSSSPHPDL